MALPGDRTLARYIGGVERNTKGTHDMTKKEREIMERISKARLKIGACRVLKNQHERAEYAAKRELAVALDEIEDLLCKGK